MGIWDALQSTADSLYRRSPDLAPVKDACRSAYGFGWDSAGAVSTAIKGKAAQVADLLHPAADKLRLSAPDLTPVSAAVSRMDHAVRIDGVQRVKEAVADPDGWQKIARIAWNLSDHALGELTKPYTGGLPAYKIVKEGLTKDQSRSAAVHGKERELQEMRDRLDRMEDKMRLMEEESGPLSYSHRSRVPFGPFGAQKPEDVLRIFMMKGFKGADFIEDQVVPSTGKAHDDFRDPTRSPLEAERRPTSVPTS